MTTKTRIHMREVMILIIMISNPLILILIIWIQRILIQIVMMVVVMKTLRFLILMRRL